MTTHRPITPEDGAPLVGSVVAVDLRIAIIEADRLKRDNPHLQGIVLHRPESHTPTGAFNWAGLYNDAQLKPYSYEGGQLAGDQVKIEFRDDAVDAKDPEFFAKYGFVAWGDAAPNPELDSIRQNEIGVLRSLFDMVSGRIQHEDKNIIRPHYDAANSSPVPYKDEERLFFGKPVHWLQARQGGGVLVPHDENALVQKGGEAIDWGNGQSLPPLRDIAFQDEAVLRQVRDGDILIFFDDTWGVEHSLGHSSPDFDSDKAGQQRVLDNYVLGGGKPLKGL